MIERGHTRTHMFDSPRVRIVHIFFLRESHRVKIVWYEGVLTSDRLRLIFLCLIQDYLQKDVAIDRLHHIW
jgi:hypothetical protein